MANIDREMVEHAIEVAETHSDDLVEGTVCLVGNPGTAVGILVRELIGRADR